MIEMSADLDKIAPALHAAQGIMTGVVKDAKNPHFKNHYATLEAVLDTARPALQAHGLSVTQAPASIVDGSLSITTMLLHASGQWLRSTLHVPLGQKRDAQAVGSAISYGRRYALMAVLGLPSVDDDGQAASAPVPASASSQRATRSQRPAPQSEQTSSQRMAVELMAALSERAGSRVDRLWDNPEFQADVRMLDDEDLQRVKDFADERRAVKPDVRAA